MEHKMRLCMFLIATCFHIVRGIPLPKLEPEVKPDNNSSVGEDLLEYEDLYNAGKIEPIGKIYNEIFFGDYGGKVIIRNGEDLKEKLYEGRNGSAANVSFPNTKTLKLGDGLEIAWGDYFVKRTNNETVETGRFWTVSNKEGIIVDIMVSKGQCSSDKYSDLDDGDKAAAEPENKDDKGVAKPENKDDMVTAEPENKDDKSTAVPENKDDQGTAEQENKDDKDATEPENKDDMVTAEPEDKNDMVTAETENKDDQGAAEPENKDDMVTTEPENKDNKGTAEPGNKDDMVAAEPENKDDKDAAEPGNKDDKDAAEPGNKDDMVTAESENKDDQGVAEVADKDDKNATETENKGDKDIRAADEGEKAVSGAKNEGGINDDDGGNIGKPKDQNDDNNIKGVPETEGDDKDDGETQVGDAADESGLDDGIQDEDLEKYVSEDHKGVAETEFDEDGKNDIDVEDLQKYLDESGDDVDNFYDVTEGGDEAYKHIADGVFSASGEGDMEMFSGGNEVELVA